MPSLIFMHFFTSFSSAFKNLQEMLIIIEKITNTIEYPNIGI